MLAPIAVEERRRSGRLLQVLARRENGPWRGWPPNQAAECSTVNGRTLRGRAAKACEAGKKPDRSDNLADRRR